MQQIVYHLQIRIWLLNHSEPYMYCNVAVHHFTQYDTWMPLANIMLQQDKNVTLALVDYWVSEQFLDGTSIQCHLQFS